MKKAKSSNESLKQTPNFEIFDPNKDETRAEKIKYIGLIFDDYLKLNPYISEAKCGELFDNWYEKSVSDLKIIYTVYK